MNVYQLTLLVLLYTVVTFLISCVSATLGELSRVFPDTGPIEIEDITFEAGSHPAYANPTIVTGNGITIGGIPNLADDAPRETLTMRIADKTNPRTYTAEPASIIIPAEALNPAGTSATNIMVGTLFTIPVGEERATFYYDIVLRLEAGR